eukprot:5215103-Pyramimonas_sp.AAC.1
MSVSAPSRSGLWGAIPRMRRIPRRRSARGIRDNTPRIRGVAPQGPGPRGHACGHVSRPGGAVGQHRRAQ